VGETLRDDAPPVWVRLERAHVITGDHEVQEGREPKALERRQGDRARVVCPERRLEAGAPRARDGVERARLERGRLHRPSLVVTLFAPPARALDEPERLRLVGERTFADGLYPIARRVLERLVADYPKDDRIGDALFLLGRARFALGDTESALEAFRRAQAATPPPASLEAKFWGAETLFRLRRFAEAHAAYDVVVKNDAAAPHAPDSAYSLA